MSGIKSYYISLSVADLGGGRGDALPPLRDSAQRPTDPKFGPTDPKFFLKAPWAPIYTNFEDERAPKIEKCFESFFSQNFSKKAQKQFFECFSKICLRRWKFSQNRGKTVLGESSKNQFGRPKKRSSKFLNYFFENPPPPLKKILDPPLSIIIDFRFLVK